MNLTKYEHACFTIEINGQFLVIDPGSFTHDLPLLTNVAGIVITHEHADHFNPDALAVLYGNNPDSILISLHEIIQKMPDHKSQAVTAGDVFSVGPFNLEFFGGTHAVIDPSMETLAL
jgi:L-ascorbate metabolism protein UlaG (beta-lactamase superfamily)